MFDGLRCFRPWRVGFRGKEAFLYSGFDNAPLPPSTKAPFSTGTEDASYVTEKVLERMVRTEMDPDEAELAFDDRADLHQFGADRVDRRFGKFRSLRSEAAHRFH